MISKLLQIVLLALSMLAATAACETLRAWRAELFKASPTPLAARSLCWLWDSEEGYAPLREAAKQLAAK